MRYVEPAAPSQSEALRLLVLAVEKLAGARTVSDVVEILRTSARNMVGADGICIVLRDEGKCHYAAEDAVGPLWKGQRFPMETCISGWAMLNAKTAVIPDIFVDPRIPHDAYRPTFVKSLVMAPIGRDEPQAALGAYWARNYQAPREVVETLETLGRAAATALENVHLVEALSASLKKTELARDELRQRLANALEAIDVFGKASLDPQNANELALRLKALSRAHARVNETFSLDGTIPLGEVVESELAPFRTGAGAVTVSGPDVAVHGAQALTIALVLNELALQAARTGGFRASSAGLTIRWRNDDHLIRLEWQRTFASSPAATAAGNIATGLVRTLVVTQLEGAIRQVTNGPNVTLTIEFSDGAELSFPAVSVA